MTINVFTLTKADGIMLKRFGKLILGWKEVKIHHVGAPMFNFYTYNEEYDKFFYCNHAFVMRELDKFCKEHELLCEIGFPSPYSVVIHSRPHGVHHGLGVVSQAMSEIFTMGIIYAMTIAASKLANDFSFIGEAAVEGMEK